MDAIKRLERYLISHNDTEEAAILRRLATSLANDCPFSLAQLYELDMSAFELAMQLLDDWRLNRFYAGRLRLMDRVVTTSPRNVPRMDTVRS